MIVNWRFKLETLLENLKKLICVRTDAQDDYFVKYIKEQTEIHELMLISSYYMLRNKYEFRSKIAILNEKYHIVLDSEYLCLRWEKFYSRKQNKNFEDAIKTYIINRDKGRCSYCSYSRDIEIHHVIPQEMNGSHSEYNLVTTCVTCNRSIGATIKIPQNWWILHPESRNKCC